MTSFVLFMEILALWLSGQMQTQRFFLYVAVTTAMFFLYVLAGVFASFRTSKLGVCAGKAFQGALFKKLLTLSAHNLKKYCQQ